MSVWRWLSSRGGMTNRSARRRATSLPTTVGIEALEARALLAISFQFDYSLDTNGFFNTSAKRNLLAAAGKIVAENLNDTLNAVTPGGTNVWTPNVRNPATGSSINLPGSTSIPANTIRVYAGGRDLPTGNLGVGGAGGFSASGSTAWINNVRARGEPGAVSTTAPTDVAPWGGAITFDSVGVDWNFSITTSGLASPKQDFLSVAVHELSHVLGISSGQKSWARFATGSTFTGPAVVAENGSAVPLASDKSHWVNGTVNDGMETAMDPSLAAGNRKLLTDLDFAGLKDIGWEVRTIDDDVYQARQRLSDAAATATETLTLNGAIDNVIDADLYRVFVLAGHRLTATASPRSGQPVVNTYLRLFDLNGTEVTPAANQGGAGGTDTLGFTVPRSDFYFVGISSSGNITYNARTPNSGTIGPTGGYRLQLTITNTAAAAAPLTASVQSGAPSITLTGEASAADVSFTAAAKVSQENVGGTSTASRPADEPVGLPLVAPSAERPVRRSFWEGLEDAL